MHVRKEKDGSIILLMNEMQKVGGWNGIECSVAPYNDDKEFVFSHAHH